MVDKFTKSDLRDRMVVETRNHLFYIVIGDWLVGISDSIKIDSYDKYLLNYYNKHDIIKVYEPTYKLDSFIQQPIGDRVTATGSAMTVLWDSTAVKEVTMAEVEERFGCKVKIVNGS